MRQYERGHEDDPKYLIWQASVGRTARECLYDEQGGLTLEGWILRAGDRRAEGWPQLT